MPSWITAAGWWGFGILAAVLAIGFEMACVGVGVAAAVMWALVTLLRLQFKPKDASEQSEELACNALRKIKKLAAESNIQKRMPTQVLLALEDAVEAHNTAIARLSTQNPMLVPEATESIRQSLNACFLAAVGVMRDDEHSAAEWKAMQDKSSLINEIVGAIQERAIQMREPLVIDTERLAALRELDQSEATHIRTR